MVNSEELPDSIVVPERSFSISATLYDALSVVTAVGVGTDKPNP